MVFDFGGCMDTATEAIKKLEAISDKDDQLNFLNEFELHDVHNTYSIEETERLVFEDYSSIVYSYEKGSWEKDHNFDFTDFEETLVYW